MSSPFVYLQLHTQDHAAAKEFYSSLFGWALQDAPPGAPAYTEVVVDDSPVGGIMPAKNASAPSQWIPFIGVPNVDEVVNAAKTRGAQVIVTPTDVPQKGRYALLADPAGALFALWTPLKAR